VQELLLPLPQPVIICNAIGQYCKLYFPLRKLFYISASAVEN
jgi:hypothetical protein